MAREGPLGEGMGGTALGLQGGGEHRHEAILDLLDREAGRRLAPGSVFFVSGLALVFIGESSITYGVLKRRNPLG